MKGVCRQYKVENAEFITVVLVKEDILKDEKFVEKPREFDPRRQATLTPASKNTLTPYGKIKMTPENDCFSGVFL